MTKVLNINGVTGKVAIYDGANGDAPFTNPLGNLGLLYFHSDLDYVGTLQKQTGTLTLPARGIGTVPYTSGRWFEHILFAHGRGAPPLCVGRVVNFQEGGGISLPLVGSVPIQKSHLETDPGHLGGQAGAWRMIHLVVDATNVMIMEYAYNIAISAAGEAWHALDVQWEVVVTDKLLT
ncbi:hypothetical protein [Rhodoligotrophos ferricapiens]|uniref:hypothetical protein n=1 Tax=Rhodoligotrophos ferricapiens TaxID=3069264 RepID=UPI00315DB548